MIRFGLVSFLVMGSGFVQVQGMVSFRSSGYDGKGRNNLVLTTWNGGELYTTCIYMRTGKHLGAELAGCAWNNILPK